MTKIGAIQYQYENYESSCFCLRGLRYEGQTHWNSCPSSQHAIYLVPELNWTKLWYNVVWEPLNLYAFIILNWNYGTGKFPKLNFIRTTISINN